MPNELARWRASNKFQGFLISRPSALHYAQVGQAHYESPEQDYPT